jgi:hypothetical protein
MIADDASSESLERLAQQTRAERLQILSDGAEVAGIDKKAFGLTTTLLEHLAVRQQKPFGSHKGQS